MEAYKKINEIVELMGPQFVVNELMQYLPTDQLDDFANHIAAGSDYKFSDEEDDEDEDEEPPENFCDIGDYPEDDEDEDPFSEQCRYNEEED